MSHKNDPDFHDVRAKILLEAARELSQHSEQFAYPVSEGVLHAAAELRRMASVARREHAKVRDKKRQAARRVGA